MTYFVKVPLVVAKQPDGSDLYLYRYAPVPESLSDDEVQRLVDGEFVEEIVAPEPVDDQPDDPYKGVNLPELKAELEKRNEGREDADKIVPAEPGNKPEVIAALIADDAKAAGN